SPTDVQPVFDAIVQSASSLCEAEFSAVVRFEDGLLHLAGTSDVSSAEFEAYHRLFPRPPRRDFIMGRAFLDGRPVHVEDVLLDPDYDPHSLGVLQHAATFRTYLGIPIVRNGIPIGAIGCGRYEVRPFTDAQVELVKTFADQAVIAIENVRLFTELQEKNGALTQAHAQVSEALEQQTATSEILRVIGSSPTEVQPVFDAIVTSAVRLLGGFSSAVFRLIDDEVSLVAYTSTGSAGDATIRHLFPRPLANSPAHARVVRDRAPYAVRDIKTAQDMPDDWRELARARGFRSGVTVPMVRGGAVIGMVTVTRREPGAFTDDHIALLQTFADQAVIAIENVRLFKELETRDRDLTDALDRQTATSDILKVISSSPTDTQPVFDAIAANAARLCSANDAQVLRLEEEVLRLVAASGTPAMPS